MSTASFGLDPISPFLNLPGELRNMIYQYVLYEPAGLRFHKDEHGVGRLEPDLIGTTTAPQLANVTQIADAIRKDGVEEEEPRKEVASHVANQLQYVSHEIRCETRGLGIRYNDIAFDALPGILTFIRICPQPEVQHLGLLRVKQGLYSTSGSTQENMVGRPDERYARLFDFCTANPSLTVHNTVIGWRQSNPMFVPYAILVQMQFRQSSSLIGEFFTCPIIQEQVRTVTARKMGEMEEVLPANFRIYPEDGEFDENLLRDTCVGDPMIGRFFDRAVEGGVERWVTGARKIYEDGI